MGCKGPNNTYGDQVYCYMHVPQEGNTTDGVNIEFREYPENPIRGGTHNIPSKDETAVMHSSVFIEEPDAGTINPGPSNCGKTYKALSSSQSPTSEPGRVYYDWYPEELSFDHIFSDTWFSLLYDTSNDQGIAGTPCFYIEDEDGSTVTVDIDGNPSSSSSSYGYTCHPCNNFTCDPAETTLSYTADEDLTGDPDCPHPTLFAFGTTSFKLAFQYDALATTQPNGVLDLSMSYTGSGYQDAWDQTNGNGIEYVSAQNPWQTGEEGIAYYETYQINNGAGTGLKIVVRIACIYDDSGASTVFTGTSWRIVDIINPGTGYTQDAVVQLSFSHLHPDSTTTTLSTNLKLTSVGDVPVTSAQEGFARLVKGDTLNGHTITRAFHTDIDNFPYHIIYLDGSGSDFTKDTQYTSSRNHLITAKAGYGIKDRAILVGLYEFLNKSIQYTTARLEEDAPDLFNTLKQPKGNVTVTDGIVTAISITDGGEGWGSLDEAPILEITAPTIPKRSIEDVYQRGELVDGDTEPETRHARVKGIFSAGVLTGVEITDGGKGYRDDYPPNIWVRNVFKTRTDTQLNSSYSQAEVSRKISYFNSFPEPGLTLEKEEYDRVTNPLKNKKQTFSITGAVPSYRVDKDPVRDRYEVQPQGRYNKNVIEPLKDFYNYERSTEYVDKMPNVTGEYKKHLKNRQSNYNTGVKGRLDKIIQPIIPEKRKYDCNHVQTVQGSLTQLPYANQYTKYLMKQYRADPRTSINIDLTLNCKPVTAGCLHFACNAPPNTPNSTSSSTDGDGNTTTTTLTYTMSDLLGSGCKEWTATGTCKIFNDLTRSTENVARATQAYGNPYDP